MAAITSDEENVERILRATNHYETLQVTEKSCLKEIEKSFKRIALLIHTDRNHAPRANEAMQKVNEARQVLKDPSRRALYDYLLRYRNRRNNDNVSNDDISGNDDDATGYDDIGGQYDTHWWETYIGNYLLVFLPVILLLLVPAIFYGLKTLFVTPPIFSLTSNSKYYIQKRTIAPKIKYYVTRNFDEEFNTIYHGAKKELEIDVKNQYKATLEIDCGREMKQKDILFEMARNTFDLETSQSLYQKALSSELLSCKKLKLFNNSQRPYIDDFFSNVFNSMKKILSFF